MTRLTSEGGIVTSCLTVHCLEMCVCSRFNLTAQLWNERGGHVNGLVDEQAIYLSQVENPLAKQAKE